MLGTIDDRTVTAFFNWCRLSFFFEYGGISFCFLFEEVVEGSDMIVSIIGHVISNLDGIKVKFLHDLNQSFIDLNGILAHDDTGSDVVLPYATVPLGFSDAIDGVSVSHGGYLVSGLTSRMALSMSLL